MAQAGLHGMVAQAVHKWVPRREWLMLGIVFGSLFPDADNILVAVATVTKQPVEGLHRTFTHSLFTIAFVVVVFYLVSLVTKNKRWNNLGIGLGIGILLHILLDLLIWFDGVMILWPLPYWLNFWENATPPDWFMTLMQPLELLFFALFFVGLGAMARKQRSDLGYLGKLRIWTWLQLVLFVVFTILVYMLQKGFMTPYGAVYLLSLALAIGVTIRMRKTVEAVQV